MNDTPLRFLGLTPYIYCEDAGAIADWLVRTFGFLEKGRHRAADGTVQNVELAVGEQELWLDGYPGHRRHGGPPIWTGIWVNDVDAMYERVKSTGVAVNPPEDKPFGVRMLTVKDPEGTSWGFIQRL